MTIRKVVMLTGLAIALTAGNASAKDYFKWVDDQGVTRYAEQPPQGVQAEKVSTTAGTSSNYDPNAGAASDDASKEAQHKAEVEERAKQLEQQEKEKCGMVANQLQVLKERGRVRMRDKDGNERVLTEEEQAAKIIELEKYMTDMCNKP